MLLPNIDYANHPSYAAVSQEISRQEREAVVGQYAAYMAQARKGFAPYQNAWQSPDRLPTPKSSPIRGDLVRDGIVGLTLPAALGAYLADMAAPYIARLHEQIAAGSGDRAAAAQIRLEYFDILTSDVGAFVKRLLADFELMPTISAYLGMPKVAVKLVHFKITDNEVSRSRGTLDVYPEPDMPDPATRYFHVDAPPCDLKLILYLSEVSELSQGPFSYVVGSHAAPYLTLEEFAVRAATQEFVSTRDPGARRKLMCLPEMYRQRIDFGSDLLEDSPVARDLLARERIFYSNDAEMVLFDSKGIHRGAMVTQGTRAVMQVTFQGLV